MGVPKSRALAATVFGCGSEAVIIGSATLLPRPETQKLRNPGEGHQHGGIREGIGAALGRSLSPVWFFPPLPSVFTFSPWPLSSRGPRAPNRYLTPAFLICLFMFQPGRFRRKGVSVFLVFLFSSTPRTPCSSASPGVIYVLFFISNFFGS